MDKLAEIEQDRALAAGQPDPYPGLTLRKAEEAVEAAQAHYDQVRPHWHSVRWPDPRAEAKALAGLKHAKANLEATRGRVNNPSK